ncbi:DNA-3-methyladenine glycosylase 2 family protein [Kitasatospora griseola]|uniref:DNA-3-methyladenine glycosylase 2 family protein n=1 Tax=Kitasatospora griseola TaxID=2064 RepID=UPI0005C438AA|nr:AlkA N-terminal domain-containing protein [Kitasatospora griseola]
MHEYTERCIRAVQSKDARFDGWFFVAVLTTKIYCRPSCPVSPPKPQNMRFYSSAAAAQQAGFRACKRCRPDAAPGSPEWNERADLVARAIRLIKDGVVDREGVPGLAAYLGYSTRQVERQLRAEVGAGPLALARAQRAQAARLLIETSTLPMAEVAFASGFSSIRSFNDTVQAVFALSPTELRRRTRPTDVAGTLTLRLPFRAPLCADSLFGRLAAAAVPGVEEWRSGAYRRTLRLPRGHGIVELRPTASAFVECRLTLSDLRDLTAAINRCRWMLDLDADPAAVDELLVEDPLLAPLVRKNPGRRVPRTVDGEEYAIRALLGQHVSAATARDRAARLAAVHGLPVTDPGGGLSRLFPAPAELVGLGPAASEPPDRPHGAFPRLVEALADGTVDVSRGSDWLRARAQLTAIPGIEPETVEVVAMGALGDPDAFTTGGPGVRTAAVELGLPATPAALARHAAAWRPWRAYALQHLWATDSLAAAPLDQECCGVC